jgi:hypothetical protein
MQAFRSGNLAPVATAAQTAVMNGGTYTVQVSVQDRIIDKVHFGHSGAIHVIEAIEFQ